MDIRLDGTSHTPLYLQLKDALVHRILTGAYPPAARLPAARLLARQLHIGRNTVDAAYRLLAEEGYIRIVAGQGAYVESVIVPQDAPQPDFPWEDRLTDFAKRARAVRVGHHVDLRRTRINFASLAPDHRLFETESFRKALSDALAREGNVLLGYGYTRGYEPLRRALAAYLAQKGISMAGKEILLVNGFRQGLELICRLLVAQGDAVLVETPCYNGALGLFEAAGARVVHVACDDGGMMPEALDAAIAAHRPRLVYVVPTYHNPTGRNMPLSRRQEMLGIARRHELPVLEDGFCEELRYRGESHPPLAALGSGGVLYVGSFSKILFPGLRVGWVVAPDALVEPLLALKYHEDIHTPLLPQAGLHAFLERGGLERHLSACRKAYAERSDAMQQALGAHMQEFATWAETDGGFSLWLTLKGGLGARELLARAQARGVTFAAGDVFYADGRGGDQVRLGFSRVTVEEIWEGVEVIAQEARGMMAGR